MRPQSLKNTLHVCLSLVRVDVIRNALLYCHVLQIQWWGIGLHTMGKDHMSQHHGEGPHVPTLRKHSWCMQEQWWEAGTRKEEVLPTSVFTMNHNSGKLHHDNNQTRDTTMELNMAQYQHSHTEQIMMPHVLFAILQQGTVTLTIPGRLTCPFSWTKE